MSKARVSVSWSFADSGLAMTYTVQQTYRSVFEEASSLGYQEVLSLHAWLGGSCFLLECEAWGRDFR